MVYQNIPLRTTIFTDAGSLFDPPDWHESWLCSDRKELNSRTVNDNSGIIMEFCNTLCLNIYVEYDIPTDAAYSFRNIQIQTKKE